MNAGLLIVRNRKFSAEIIRFFDTLETDRRIHGIIAHQLLRCSTSVGANYRAACRSRSQAEFVSRIRVVEEEADECCYWLELMLDSSIGVKGQVQSLLKEAEELTAIFAASGKTARKNLELKKGK